MIPKFVKKVKLYQSQFKIADKPRLFRFA